MSYEPSLFSFELSSRGKQEVVVLVFSPAHSNSLLSVLVTYIVCAYHYSSNFFYSTLLFVAGLWVVKLLCVDYLSDGLAWPP